MLESTELIGIGDFEGEDDEEQVSIPESDRQITWESSSPSAFDLHRRKTRGNLELQPSFQRRLVWDDKKKSRFIESILLDIPLPYFYLAEQPDGKQVVVDGQQRLNAIFSYLEGNLVLQGLSVIDTLNGKLFGDLDEASQNRIEIRPLHTILIKSGSNEHMKYDVFERLNTGAVQLNPQELRNCLQRGRFNDLIIELSETSDFQKLCGFSGPHSRMKDVEQVLRFFAFCDFTYQNYKKPMKRFLDDEMKARRNLRERDAQRLRQTFVGAVNLSNTVFDEKAFRRYDTLESGGRWRPKPNIALQDVIMYGFAKRLDQRGLIIRNSDAIRESLLNILATNDEFIGSLETHTSDEDRVKYRFDTWMKEIDEILSHADEQQGSRLFSLELKRSLYTENPTCRICRQQIHSIDDSEVDHIQEYWKGGRTIPANARLTHRYCNRARGRGDSTV